MLEIIFAIICAFVFMYGLGLAMGVDPHRPKGLDAEYLNALVAQEREAEIQRLREAVIAGEKAQAELNIKSNSAKCSRDELNVIYPPKLNVIPK